MSHLHTVIDGISRIIGARIGSVGHFRRWNAATLTRRGIDFSDIGLLAFLVAVSSFAFTGNRLGIDSSTPAAAILHSFHISAKNIANAQIAFVDDDRIAIEFRIRRQTGEPFRGGYLNDPNAALKIVILNTRNGEQKTIVENEWSVFSQIHSLAGAHFLLRQHDRLEVFNSRAEKIATSQLPISGSGRRLHYAEVKVSLQANRVYVIQWPPSTQVDILDAAFLQGLSRFELPKDFNIHSSFSFSDTLAAYNAQRQTLVQRIPPGGELTSVCTGCAFGDFVAKSAIFTVSTLNVLTYASQRWILYDANGNELLRRELPKGEFANAASALDCKRFVIIYGREKGGSAWLDIYPHAVYSRVELFDSASLRSLLTLKLKDHRPDSTFAISPSGDRIAYARGGKVKVISLE